MTKLQRKIQARSKKRARQRGVAKRKLERLAQLKEKRYEALNEAEKGADDLNQLSREMDEEAEENERLQSKQMQLIGGLAVEKVMKKKGSRLTRKQRKRKERGMDRGKADADRLQKKWERKKIRVKERAIVRNMLDY